VNEFYTHSCVQFICEWVLYTFMCAIHMWMIYIHIHVCHAYVNELYTHSCVQFIYEWVIYTFICVIHMWMSSIHIHVCNSYMNKLYTHSCVSFICESVIYTFICAIHIWMSYIHIHVCNSYMNELYTHSCVQFIYEWVIYTFMCAINIWINYIAHECHMWMNYIHIRENLELRDHTHTHTHTHTHVTWHILSVYNFFVYTQNDRLCSFRVYSFSRVYSGFFRESSYFVHMYTCVTRWFHEFAPYIRAHVPWLFPMCDMAHPYTNESIYEWVFSPVSL